MPPAGNHTLPVCPRSGPQAPVPEHGMGHTRLLRFFCAAPQPAAESGEHHGEHGITHEALCKPQPTLRVPEPQRILGTSESVTTWRSR